MNDESLRALLGCLELCERLRHLVQEDTEQLGAFLSGPVLEEYRKNSDLALERIEELKNLVLSLHSREELGL